MNNVDLKTYLPIMYQGIAEVEAQQDALSIEINKLHATYQQALMDQFVQHASLKAIVYYENIFNIVGNPSTESLQFRRERVLSRMKMLTPPYTYWYFRMMLDGFFGKGKYKLSVDNDNFTITLESSSDDSLWYHEIQVSITAVKPCNMIFINIPRVTENLLVNEQVNSTERIRNYKLNKSWLLGLRPFITINLEEIKKMPNTPSIEKIFIDKNIQHWETLFYKSLLNDSIVVTDITIEKGEDNVTISYIVDTEMTDAITNIKLIDFEENTLVSSNVFIPIEDSVIIKHIIKLEEGVNA